MLIKTNDKDFEKEWFDCKEFQSTKELAFYFWCKGEKGMETSQERIERFQKEIEKEQHTIQNCNHEYDKAVYDAETKRVGYGIHMVGQGSDVWSDFDGYEDKTIARWSKKCVHCGHKIYAYNQKPIVTGYEPDFGVR